MKDIKISKRLKYIASLIDNDSVVYDVGCDHGLLSCYLNKYKNCYVIGSDIGVNSIKLANNNNLKYDCRCEFYVSNGLHHLNKKIDYLVISGLGGHSIIDIISNKIEYLDKMILSPQRDLEYFRKAIHNYGYKFKEHLIYDKNFYHIFEIEKGIDKYTDLEYKYGKDYLNSDICRDYFKYLEKLYEYKNDKFIKRYLKTIETNNNL